MLVLNRRHKVYKFLNINLIASIWTRIVIVIIIILVFGVVILGIMIIVITIIAINVTVWYKCNTRINCWMDGQMPAWPACDGNDYENSRTWYKIFQNSLYKKKRNTWLRTKDICEPWKGGGERCQEDGYTIILSISLSVHGFPTDGVVCVCV